MAEDTKIHLSAPTAQDSEYEAQIRTLGDVHDVVDAIALIALHEERILDLVSKLEDAYEAARERNMAILKLLKEIEELKEKK